jgi:hypothetical protein
MDDGYGLVYNIGRFTQVWPPRAQEARESVLTWLLVTTRVVHRYGRWADRNFTGC